VVTPPDIKDPPPGDEEDKWDHMHHDGAKKDLLPKAKDSK